ncbi:MAG: hypothetical protein ACT4P6_23915 [Gemmatimonadaceae bacterium]
MNRIAVARFVALVLLLIHGSAYAAATLLDGGFAARANAAVAHVEGKAGSTCVAHDESTCQICRAVNTMFSGAQHSLAIVPLVRSARPNADARAQLAAVARSALHSRAPPVA